MSLYTKYLTQIEERKAEGLSPKPIEDGGLAAELISQIKDVNHEHRQKSLDLLIYNTLPGTTSAATEKANFLGQIITGEFTVEEISAEFAFELLSHMKGGPSVKVLLDLALGDDFKITEPAATVLKTQVFLYDADTDRLKAAFNDGNIIAERRLCKWYGMPATGGAWKKGGLLTLMYGTTGSPNES